jgi:2',3'-cyclic-nucleotide 2'-phosphodiesterase (5'-nucleotidase family)
MNETSDEAFLRGETHRTLFRLFAINDVYSILPVNGVGGMAELSTLLNEKRKEKVLIDLHNGGTTEIVPPSFFFLNGDFLSGSELGERFQGEHMIQIMNKLKTDAVVVG